MVLLARLLFVIVLLLPVVPAAPAQESMESPRRDAVIRESSMLTIGEAGEPEEERDARSARRPAPKRKRDLSHLLLLWILQSHPLQ